MARECSIHGVPLNKDGDCPTCLKLEAEYSGTATDDERSNDCVASSKGSHETTKARWGTRPFGNLRLCRKCGALLNGMDQPVTDAELDEAAAMVRQGGYR